MMIERDRSRSGEARATSARGNPRGTRTLLLGAAIATAAAAPARAQAIAIEGATVWTAPGKQLDGATIVIANGTISAVGAGAAIPAGATKIDGRGKIVTAGFIDGLTQLGLVEVDLEASSVDGRFGATPTTIHAAYRASDAYDARSVVGPIARDGGVTSVIVAPAGGLISGQSAWMTLDDRTGARAAVRDPAAMHAGLGGGAVATGSRGKAIEQLRELLDDAAAFHKNRAAYDKNQSRQLAAARLDLEALGPVLRGRLPLVVRADSEPDLRAALRIARERRLRLVIAGGVEAWRVADELAAAKVPVILDPTRNLPDDLVGGDVRDDLATVLDEAGVTVAISTLGGTWNVRTLRQLAGVAVAHGLPWDKALAAITTVPASIYGAADRGTIARGAPADLVVWSGDPLELSSRPEVVIVGGVVQPAEHHQTRLRDRYRKLPAAKPAAKPAP
jgi:imidazolonepropionase-like amidohydrolase